MSAPDYSGVMSLLPLNWEAGDETFRYLVNGEMDRIVAAFEADGNPLDTEDVGALHEAAWAYRARVLA